MAVGKDLILVIDDDVSLSEMLQIVLRKEGYDTAWCGNGADAIDVVQQTNPALILLDVMLPGLNGIDVCKKIRNELQSGVPIVMLTARSDTADVVTGLEAGADDYIPKPFKPRELFARVKARLRHFDEVGSFDVSTLKAGDLEVDVAAHEVRRAGQPINLTPLEFDLLLALAKKPNQVFSRESLLEQVWGYRHASDTRLVNVHVQRLRSKIELDPERPQIVLTVRGVGYKACDPE